jgi:cytochrome c biogenesis protein CcdA
MGAGVIGLAFLAGLLTVLSPCVLPLVPHAIKFLCLRETVVVHSS